MVGVAFACMGKKGICALSVMVLDCVGRIVTTMVNLGFIVLDVVALVFARSTPNEKINVYSAKAVDPSA